MFDDRDPGDETDLDAIAEAQAAQEAERAKIDAAASLDAAQSRLKQAGQQQYPTNADEALDPHGAEREALGFELAWWADEGEANTPPLDIVTELTNQACGKTHYLRELEEFGFDRNIIQGYVGLDAVSGMLVVTALQILGTLHSHIRDDVTEVLKQLRQALPDETPEQVAAYSEAAQAHEQAQVRKFAAAMGIDVDEVAEEIVRDDAARRDARNN